MIHFSNLDKNYEEAIYNFLLINNFKSDLNNYYTKLMIMDNVMPIIKKWFASNKDDKAQKLVRLLYQIVTSRSPLSSRFVIAKG